MISTSEKKSGGRRSEFGNIESVVPFLEDYGGKCTKDEANAASGSHTICAIF